SYQPGFDVSAGIRGLIRFPDDYRKFDGLWKTSGVSEERAGYLQISKYFQHHAFLRDLWPFSLSDFQSDRRGSVLRDDCFGFINRRLDGDADWRCRHAG